MIKFFKLASLAGFAIGGLFASSITSVTSNLGTVGTFNVTDFAAASNNMAGLMVVVNYVGGGSSMCTWSNASGGCSVSGGFSISEADGTAGSFNGTWSLQNNHGTATHISSIVLLGSGALDNPGGHIGFDLCWNSNGTPNYSNTGGGSTSCGVEGTLGSNIGWSASGVGATGPTASSATYTDAVKVPSAAVVGDEFSKVTIAFADTAFANQATFTWRMDTDILAAAVPEPATSGLVGLSLLALGAVSVRRRRKN